MISPRDRLPQVNAALGVSWAVAQLGGPALGGILVAVWGPHGAAAFDSVSYFLSAVAIALMRIPALPHARPDRNGWTHEIESVGRQLWEGLNAVLRRPILRVVFGSVGIFTLSQGVTNVLLVVVVNRIWHGGAPELGWLISAQGIGALIGSGLIGSINARISSRMLIVVGGIGLGLLVLAAVNQPSVYVAMALLAACGVLVVAIDVGWTKLIQLGSDDENRGRVAALLQTNMAAFMMISIGITSALTDQIGVAAMVDAGALAMIAGGIAGLWVPRASQPQVLSEIRQPAE